MNTMKNIIRCTIAVTLLLGMVGCDGMTTRQKDTAVGAVGGAVVGDVLGTPGGAVGGAVIGGVIGNQVGKDKK